MNKRIILIVTIIILAIVGLGVIYKIHADSPNTSWPPTPKNDYLTDEALVLVDKSNGMTAIYCHYEWNTGQVNDVYGNTIPTNEVSNYKFGCAKHTIHIKE